MSQNTPGDTPTPDQSQNETPATPAPPAAPAQPSVPTYAPPTQAAPQVPQAPQAPQQGYAQPAAPNYAQPAQSYAQPAQSYTAPQPPAAYSAPQAPGYAAPAYNPQQSYVAYGYAGPVQPKGLAITSMVLGIVGLVFCLFFFTVVMPFLGFVCSVVGLILGIVALKKQQSRGMALAGVITSAIAVGITLLVGILVASLLFSVVAAAGSVSY